MNMPYISVNIIATEDEDNHANLNMVVTSLENGTFKSVVHDDTSEILHMLTELVSKIESSDQTP